METAATANEPPEQRFANAIAYRMEKIGESRESIIDELLSDIPHAKDFTQSVAEIVAHLASLNIASAVGVAPKLLLSGTGIYAAWPNVKTIWQEKKFHREQLKATFKLYCEHKRTGDETVIERKEGLELEVPEMPDAALEGQDLKRVREYLAYSRLQRVSHRLRHPTAETLKAGAVAAAGFVWDKVKDIGLNLWWPSRLKKIARGGFAGLTHAYQYHFHEKAEIRELTQLKTIYEKIQEALASGQKIDAIALRERHIALSQLKPEDVERLDSMTASVREVAKQFQTAAEGVSWNGVFIVASLGLTIYHAAKFEVDGMLMQWSAASLAANPFRFVGQQAEDLYQALHSKKAEVALEEARIIAERAHLDPPITNPDLQNT